MSPSYDLVTEAWIPVARADGTFTTESLGGLLAGPEQYAALADANPLAEIATLRLLVAITQAALQGPVNERDRLERFQAGFPAAEVAAYLHEHRTCFDLFHPTRPFFQDPALNTVIEDWNQRCRPSDRKSPKPAVDLGYPQMAAGYKILHSHAYHGSGRVLEAGEAARLLLAHQAFARAGMMQIGGSGKIGVLAGGLVVAPEGRDLAQTLLLCLQAKTNLGRPVWEGTPSGWLGRLAWPSRRILLYPDPTEALVTHVVIGTGRPAPDEAIHREPMFAYYPSRTTARTRVRVQAERATWRDVTALYQSDGRGGMGADILTEARMLLRAGSAGEGRIAAVNVYGAPGGGQKEPPALWVRDRFPLPVEFLQPGSPAVVQLNERLREADQVDRELGKQLAAAFRRGNKDLKLKREYRPTVRPLATYWWALEPSFRVLLADYAAHPMTIQRIDAANRVWAGAVRAAARRCFAQATQVIALSPRSGHALVRAEAQLNRQIDKILA